MKIKLFLLSTLMPFTAVFSQQSKTDDTEVIYCSEFHVTAPLSELISKNPAPAESDQDKREMEDRKTRTNQYFQKFNQNSEPVGDDPVLQKNMGNKMMLPPIANWQAQSGSGYPPDPSGAAGPNHYVQAVNTSYRIYNKTGTAQAAAANLGTLLFGVNDGDPIVMYDKTADRWFISQFGISGNKIYIGISQTANPLGAYYTYQFTASQFPDYLKFSIWWDGYYMTANTSTQRVYAFERSQMLLGNAASRMISKTFSPANGGNFFCPLTGNADGPLPASGTPCPIFSYEDDGWGGSFQDRINIYEMAVNWVPTTPTATITLAAQLPVQAFDASYNANWNDISQPGTTQKLDAIGGVFTYRAQWRQWTGYSSTVLCHATKANGSSTQFGIRWYELRKTGSTWSVYQQGTYAPDALNRWLGSIAMDDNGSIGMAYAVSGVNSGTNVYPSIRYTGRVASDPLGTFTFAEEVAIAGSSAQTGLNRYGDYSQTSLDPDGYTFWHTGEYIGTGGAVRTRIFSFQIPNITGIKEKSENNEYVLHYQNGLLSFKTGELPENTTYSVDVFDYTGKLITSQNMQCTDHRLSGNIDLPELSSGIYLFRIGINNSSFQKVIKFEATK